MINNFNPSELLPIGNFSERVAYTKQEAQLVITIYGVNAKEDYIFLPYTNSDIDIIDIAEYTGDDFNDDYVKSWKITLNSFSNEYNSSGHPVSIDKVCELIVYSSMKPTYRFEYVK